MKLERYSSVVPWRSPAQFYKVFRYLYSANITDKRWAVEQISVWESRCHPALPTAVEATVGLVRAVIQDLLFEMEKSFCQAKDIQMIYAMALVRFVNLTLEVDQNAKNKIQMSILAEKRSIPKWIVDLRHEAVHTYCPSLPVLRIGAQTALKYLEETFWKVEAINIRPIVKEPCTVKHEIFDLISKYRHIQHCRREKKGDYVMLCSDLAAILKKLRKYIEDSKEAVISAALEPGAFICAGDVLRILQASAPVYMELDEDMSLPTELEKFWLPFLRVLHQFDLIPMFLEKLLLSQQYGGIRISHKVAAAWAMRFLLATSAYATDSPLDVCFKEKGVLFDLHRLLYASMRGVNKYSIQVFDMIVNRLGNKERYSQLFCIIALYQGWFVDKVVMDPPCPVSSTKRPRDTTLSDIYFTMGDVEDDLHELKRKRPRRDDNNIWSLASVNLKMAEIPLGAVLNPVIAEDCPIKEELKTEKTEKTDTEERFILINKNDNEEVTVEEENTPDAWLKTFQPESFAMVYRK